MTEVNLGELTPEQLAAVALKLDDIKAAQEKKRVIRYLFSWRSSADHCKSFEFDAQKGILTTTNNRNEANNGEQLRFKIVPLAEWEALLSDFKEWRGECALINQRLDDVQALAEATAESALTATESAPSRKGAK